MTAATKRKPKRPPLATDGPTLEATEAGIVVHFHRLQLGGYVGGAWPTIEACGKCSRAAVRVGAGSWIHVGLMQLGLDNEPRIVPVDRCGRVLANGVSAGGLKGARKRYDNPPEAEP